MQGVARAAKQAASPVSNGGRGLKRRHIRSLAPRRVASPVSNGGRGLKPPGRAKEAAAVALRPSAMAGVD